MLFQSSPALTRTARLRNVSSRKCEEKQNVHIFCLIILPLVDLGIFLEPALGHRGAGTRP
jgi:hypothetical protein